MHSLHIAANLIRRTMGTRRGLFMNVLVPAIILSILAGLFARMETDKPVVFVMNDDLGILGDYMTQSLLTEKFI